MNKQTLLAATALIVMAAGAIAVFQASGRPDLRGTWSSGTCEISSISDDRSYFVKQTYTFTQATWKRVHEAYIDSACDIKFFTVEESGTYEIGDKPNRESEVNKINHKIDSIRVTANNANMAQALSQSKCAGVNWDVDVAQEIAHSMRDTNCLNIVHQYSQCDHFNEVVKREGDILLISKYKPSFCTSENESGTQEELVQLKKSQ
jgi:type 1 fimbria pilin